MKLSHFTPAFFCLLFSWAGVAHAQTTWTVDSGGGGNFTSVAAAIADAGVVNGDIISIVSAGGHSEGGINVTKNLQIRNDTGSTATFTNGAGDGITISSSDVTLDGLSANGSSGIGIFANTAGATVVITNCDVSTNGSAGIRFDQTGTYSISTSTISNNTFEGIARFFNASATPTTINISDTTISNNGGNGARIDVFDAGQAQQVDVSILDSTFDSNNSGGEGNFIFLGRGARTLTAERTEFIYNSTGTFQNIHMTGSDSGTATIDLTNCLLQGGNDAAVGVRTAGGAATINLTHCTLVGNLGASNNGIVLNDDSSQTAASVILNSIVSDFGTGVLGIGGATNAGSDSNQFDNTTNHSGVSAGTNLQTGDPQYVDFAGGDFDLLDASPAVNSAPDLGVTDDFLGRTRPFDGSPDRGAFENQTVPVELSSFTLQ